MDSVLCVVGTRPEAIKMAPVVRALEASGKFRVLVCATGQHREMLDEALAAFAIRPSIDLEVMRAAQTPAEVAAKVLCGVGRVLDELRPARLLVQGDTTTTTSAALAAFYRRVPVGHVEAGLRTGDLCAPFPEEANRRIASIVADLHFAPTEVARHNLLAEGVAADRVHVTGNTVIDALFMTVEQVRDDPTLAAAMIDRIPALSDCVAGRRRLILVTAHRRESFGAGLRSICAALTALAGRPDVEIVYPVHLNPQVVGHVRRLLGSHRNVHLVEPMDYRRFVWLMVHAALVLTDSGGVQEEAPALGRPVLVMRARTERLEAVEAGVVRLVGTEPARIIDEVARLLDDPGHHARMSRPTFCYGDGRAAERIVKVLKEQMG